MAKTKISEYDSTSANNTDVDSINIAEGCAPSGINNAIREVMAHLKDFQTGASGDSLTVSGTFTSGTVDINGGAIDGATVGATTPATGSFTNLTASGTVTIPDNAISGDKVEGGTINAITINTLSANPTLSAGTANGVTYLNGSKVLTSGSALTFDGTNLTSTTGKFGTGAAANSATLMVNTTSGSAAGIQLFQDGNESWIMESVASSTALRWTASGSEAMRLTSTGLGIGTSSPSYKLQLNSGSAVDIETGVSNSAGLSRYGTRGSGNAFVGAFTAGKSLELWSAGAQNAVLDSSGNLGLGVTPSAWGTTNSVKGFQLPGVSLWGYANTNAYLSANSYFNGSSRIYVTSSYATEYAQTAGQHQWYTAPSGTAGAAISFTQAMTLDASGNLGIGVTSPGVKLDVSDSTANQVKARIVSTGGTIADFSFDNTGASPSTVRIGSSGTALVLKTAGTERLRIDSSGNLLVGTTSTSTTGGGFVVGGGTATYFEAGHITGTGSGSYYTVFKYNGSLIGGITQNGTTAVAYNTSSDYRLKEDWQPMTGASERVKALKPVNFAWKADGSRVDGFLAHEAQAVVPEAVTGEKDAVELVDIKDEDGNVTGQEERPVYQGIDQSKLVPLLTAALQEALAEIESLKARLDAANL